MEHHIIKKVVVLLEIILLAGFVGLIVIGQKNIGYMGVIQMVAGLAGILGLLFIYNRQHK
ncbi:MAG: hypothetical protein PHG02_01240 [Oscillospiraceae bacterium]|nr:hypothetical protein [Oscillospiraceae bacterium]